MRCPNCGTESNISTGFCMCCGSQLPENAEQSNEAANITPVTPGENFFPPENTDSPVVIAEKLSIDTGYEDAKAEHDKKIRIIIISVVCGVLALASIIIGIYFATRGSQPEETTNPDATVHIYDEFYNSVTEIEQTKHYFINADVSTADGQFKGMKYALNGSSVCASGIFDGYDVIINADSLYIIAQDGLNGALVPEDMLSLCKGFTKESCTLSMSYFGIEKPASEPTETVNAENGLSCTFTATDVQKTNGIYSYTSVFDSNGNLKSTEYFDANGNSLKTIKYNQISGQFDQTLYFNPSATTNIYKSANDVRTFLGTVFEEEAQGDITVSELGLTCSVPSGLFAIYSGVKQEDAVRCGFTETDTASVLNEFNETVFMVITDGTQQVGTLNVYSTTADSYSSLSAMTEINNALMDYYAASCDSVSFGTNCTYNGIRYTVMDAYTRDNKYAVIYDTVHGGLHFEFIFAYQTKEHANQAKATINKIIESIKIDVSAITAAPPAEHPEYNESISDYGIDCTVPSGWFAISSDTTANEAAALGFSSINIDTYKSLLEPDAGIFAVLASLQSSDNITCEFYAADEPDRNTLDTASLNVTKNDIADFYKDKYGSSAVMEETVKYNNIVYFVINTGNRVIYDTVYAGYYYVFSYNTAVITDSSKNILKDFVSSVSVTPSLITVVPSVSYVPITSQSYSFNIGDTALSCLVPTGWMGINSDTDMNDAVIRGFNDLDVSHYTKKINNSERLVSCIVCEQSEIISSGTEIDISRFTYNSPDFISLSTEDFNTAISTFTGYYTGAFDSVEYSGTVTYNGLKYIIISAYASGKGVRIYETVNKGLNYTIYMEGRSGSLSPNELSALNSFVSSVSP